MQITQESISDGEIEKKFTELRQELGDKLKYSVDELCEIYHELYKNGYTINGFLGSGAEGPVFSVVNNGSQIAVKVISGSDASKIENELKIMETFKNQPYIHQYIKAFYSESQKYFFYLTEKLTCDLESIMLVMKDKKSNFSYNQIIAFVIQMTTALSILESNKVIHSDLKPANILYDQNNKCFKMSDYGFSKIIQQQQSKAISATKNINGCTFKYAAPEIWKQNQDYTCKIDIYSLGLIILELICGIELSLFQATGISTGAASASNYLNDSGKQYDSLNRIIQSMLVIDRQSRISASSLLQKLRLLQSEEESNLCKQLLEISSYLKIRVDEVTLQNMEYNLKWLKQLHSSSLTQINIANIKDTEKLIKWDSVNPQIVQPLFKYPTQLKFKDWIKTIEQLTEAEEALTKYQNDINTGLDVGLKVSGEYSNDLTELGTSVVASRLASGLGKCSASITSLSLSLYRLEIGPEGMKNISQSIGMMHQNLTVLSLSFWEGAIGPEGASSLATAIEKCSKNLLVVGLEFNSCKMGSDGIKYISQSLEKCGNMTTLGLCLEAWGSDQVKIGPTGVSYLASSLQKCKSLIELTLSLWDQAISNEGLQSLGSSLSKCEKLTRLNARICRDSKESPMNEQSIEEFGSSLARCPNLITLSVEFCSYANHLTYAITPSLPLFAKLTTLTLFLHKDDAENISTLCANLKKCQNLTSLCLQMSNSELDCGSAYRWTPDKVATLTESLEKSDLTALKLIFEYFSFYGEANCLGESFLRFKKLTNLYLFFHGNRCDPTEFISTLLSGHLTKNKNITTLSLGANGDSDTIKGTNGRLSSPGTIGKSLEECKYIKALTLYLWENRIYSGGALGISESLQKCAHLAALELSIVEDHCCNKDYHEHVYTHYMDSVSPTIANDLKECKHLGELKVKVRSTTRNNDFCRKMRIKLGILTKFECDFW